MCGFKLSCLFHVLCVQTCCVNIESYSNRSIRLQSWTNQAHFTAFRNCPHMPQMRISHKITYYPCTWTLMHVSVIIHHPWGDTNTKEHKINTSNLYTRVHVGKFMYMDGLWFCISCVHLYVYVGDYSHSEWYK